MFQRRVSNREKFIMFYTHQNAEHDSKRENDYIYMICGGLGNETKAAKFKDSVYLEHFISKEES